MVRIQSESQKSLFIQAFLFRPAYCYILYSLKLDKYYVVSTTDIDKRLQERNRGKEKFTKTGLPWELVYTELFEKLKQAKQKEVYIKKMKSRKYIQVLVGSN